MLFDRPGSTSFISTPLFAQHASLDNRHSHRFATADDLADDSIAMLESLTSLEPRPLQSIVEFCRAIFFHLQTAHFRKAVIRLGPNRSSSERVVVKPLRLTTNSIVVSHRSGPAIASQVVQSHRFNRPHARGLSPSPRNPAHEWTRRTPGPAGPRLCGASPRVRPLPIRLIPLLTTQPSHPSPN